MTCIPPAKKSMADAWVDSKYHRKDLSLLKGHCTKRIKTVYYHIFLFQLTCFKSAWTEGILCALYLAKRLSEFRVLMGTHILLCNIFWELCSLLYNHLLFVNALKCDFPSCKGRKKISQWIAEDWDSKFAMIHGSLQCFFETVTSKREYGKQHCTWPTSVRVKIYFYRSQQKRSKSGVVCSCELL